MGNHGHSNGKPWANHANPNEFFGPTFHLLRASWIITALSCGPRGRFTGGSERVNSSPVKWVVPTWTWSQVSILGGKMVPKVRLSETQTNKALFMPMIRCLNGCCHVVHAKGGWVWNTNHVIHPVLHQMLLKRTLLGLLHLAMTMPSCRLQTSMSLSPSVP